MTSKITPKMLNEMRGDITAALEEVAAKYNVVFTPGNAKYTDLTASLTLKMALQTGESETPLDADAVEYRRSCGFFQLKESWLFEIFRLDGKTYKVVGLKPNNRRYPVIVEATSGARYKMTAEQVIAGFA